MGVNLSGQWAREQNPSGVIPTLPGSSWRDYACLLGGGGPVASVLEGLGARADSLRLVWHLCGPVLAWDSFAGPVD